MITQKDKDYGFDENDVEELMGSFYEVLHRISPDKHYEGED